MMKDTQDTIRFILPDGTRFRLTRTRLYVKRSRRIARNRGQLPFAHGASGESYFLNHISWELTGQRIILRTRGGSKSAWSVPATHLSTVRMFTAALLERQKRRALHRVSAEKQGSSSAPALLAGAIAFVAVALGRFFSAISRD